MTAFSSIWDGAEHELVPGEDFPKTGATFVVERWDEMEEEEELSPFESISREPELRETGWGHRPGSLPGHSAEQAWGSLSVVLGAFAEIIGVKRHQYQQHNYTTNTNRWTFQTDEFVAERI